MGDLKRATHHLTLSLKINQSIYGKDHASTISSLISLGKVNETQEDYRGALNCQRAVYGFYKKRFGGEDVKVKELGISLEALTVLAVQSAKNLRLALKETVV